MKLLNKIKQLTQPMIITRQSNGNYKFSFRLVWNYNLEDQLTGSYPPWYYGRIRFIPFYIHTKMAIIPLNLILRWSWNTGVFIRFGMIKFDKIYGASKEEAYKQGYIDGYNQAKGE